MLFERLEIQAPSLSADTITNWYIGQSISTSDEVSFNKNNSKPILFFNNGLMKNTSLPIKLKFGTEPIVDITRAYICGNTNDELIDQVTDTINWNSEIDPWHNSIVANSLYFNYWRNWIESIYNLKQRKISLTAYLPPRYV
jgi:hypothetical protein